MAAFEIIIAIFLLFHSFLSTYGSSDPPGENSDHFRSAEPPSPTDLNRKETEQELADMLYSKRVVFPPEDPEKLRAAIENRELKTYTFYSDIKTAGRIVSETTVNFEGCVMVQRLRRPRLVVSNRETFSVWFLIEDRINVGFLNTYPPQIVTRPRTGGSASPENGGSASPEVWINVPFRGDIADRLNKLNRQERTIRDEGYMLFPDDVPARLSWFSREYDTKLTDKIYLQAGETTYFEGGVSITTPVSYDLLFSLPRSKSEHFIYLLHYYTENFCDEGPSTEQ